jgi:hypothetical protein
VKFFEKALIFLQSQEFVERQNEGTL